jgi:hypothetical protein
MAHLISILVTLGLLAGLAAFLERTFRANGAAIREALLGARSGPGSIEAALERIGNCLRASFPAREHEAPGPDLAPLLVQLSSRNSLR